MKIKHALQEYLLDIEVRKYTPKTIRSYRNNLNLFVRYLDEEADIFDTEDAPVGFTEIRISSNPEEVCNRDLTNVQLNVNNGLVTVTAKEDTVPGRIRGRFLHIHKMG